MLVQASSTWYRLRETTDQGKLVTVRSHALFKPLATSVSMSEQVHFTDPVVLPRSPLRLSFSYAGPDRIFRDNWRDMDVLPTAIMLTVRDANERVLSVSTVTPVHVNAPASDGKSGNGSPVDRKDDTKDDGNTPAAGPKQQDGS